MRDTIQEAYMSILAQELEEGKIKNAALAVATAGALLGGSVQQTAHNTSMPNKNIIQSIKKPAQKTSDDLKKVILAKFNVDDSKANQIVHAAIKHSHPVFPQAQHLLALAGIESSFNDKAVSKLKNDPARGLTQIRPMVWNIPPKELSTIDGQIKHASNILKTYHEKLGDPDKAIAAYNIGITNLNLGKKRDAAQRYLTKFKNELNRYQD